MIDPKTVERITEAADILDVVGDYVSLKRRGVNYLGLCPFHNEKTPSFIVSPAKGLFKCFGCGKGGNAVNFVMEHEHLSYPEALKMLAKKYQIPVEEKERTPEEIREQNARESLMLVSDWANKFFKRQLHETEEGRAVGLSYFRERQFTDATIEAFELGYSPEQRDALMSGALTAGYKLEYLTETGLAVSNETNTGDRFRARVIFPIHNLSGRPIAFGGRALRTDKKLAKYVNSPESAIYHKSSVLYGIFQAKNSISKFDQCILVEGYTDVISLYQAGIQNVVASSGTSLTEGQIRLIKRFTNNLTILYDGDAAGIKASLRGIDLVLAQDMNVRVALLPDGHDPDSFAKAHSEEQLRDFIEKNATDFINFKIKLLLGSGELDTIARAAAINDIVRSISKVEDEIKRQLYVKETHQLLGFDERKLSFQVSNLLAVEQQKEAQRQQNVQNRTQLRPEIDAPPPQNHTPENLPVGPADDFERLEFDLLSYLVQFANEPLVFDNDETLRLADFVIDELQHDEIQFRNLHCRAVFDYLANLLTEAQLPEGDKLVKNPDQMVAAASAYILSRDPQLSDYWQERGLYKPPKTSTYKRNIIKNLLAYKTRWLLHKMESLQQQIRSAAPAEIMNLMQQYNQYNQIKVLMAKELGDRVIVN